MTKKTLWKRLAATVLAAVLAVPTAMMSAQDADAKTLKTVILDEDFSDADYDERICAYGASNLQVTNDGYLKVTGNGADGARWILPVEENTTYHISYRVKVEMLNATTSTFAFRQSWKMNEDGTDVDGSYAEPVYADPNMENVWPAAGWKQVETTYTVPADKNRTQFVVYNNDPNVDFEIYLDDIKVEKEVSVNDVIANGTFGTDAADTTGWNLSASTKTPKMETVWIANENFDNGTSEITITPFSAGVCELKDGAVKITGKGGARFDAMPVKAGQTYTISYRHKLCTEGLQTNGYVQTYYNGADHKSDYLDGKLAFTAPLNEWFEASTTVTVPEGKNQLYLTVYNNNNTENAEFWVDDLKIYTEAAATETTYETVYDVEGFDNADTVYSVNWSGNKVVAGEGVNGTSAQKMERPVGATSNALLYFTSETAFFEKDVTYLVKFKARSTDTASWRCYYDRMGTSDWTVLGDYSGTTEWAEYSYTFTATDSLTWPQAGFQIVGGAGCLYIDDFVIQKAVKTPVYNISDGVGEFGKDGYGAQITDTTATAADLNAAPGWYDFSIDVKGAEGTSATIKANDTAAGTYTGNGNWETVTGTIQATDALDTFAVTATGTILFDNVELYAHQHNATKVPGTPATCENEGTEDVYVCEACGKMFSDADCTVEVEKAGTIAKKEHKMTKHAEVKATCTKDGTAAYYTCETCKGKFADEAGMTKIDNPATIAKHKATYVKAVAATYTKTGMKAYYKCSCGKLYTDKACTKATTKAKLTVAKKTLAKTSIKKVTAKSKAVLVKWTKKSGVTGYEIQVYSDKKCKKLVKKTTVKGASKVSATVKGLKGKKTYYVRICIYKTEGKVTAYSAWSAAKKVTTKK